MILIHVMRKQGPDIPCKTIKVNKNFFDDLLMSEFNSAVTPSGFAVNF